MEHITIFSYFIYNFLFYTDAVNIIIIKYLNQISNYRLVTQDTGLVLVWEPLVKRVQVCILTHVLLSY